MERLNKERELVGIYLSAHPLDDYAIVLNHVCNTKVTELENKEYKKAYDNFFIIIIFRSFPTHLTAFRDTPLLLYPPKEYAQKKRGTFQYIPLS